jgi:hypothetical protein
MYKLEKMSRRQFGLLVVGTAAVSFAGSLGIYEYQNNSRNIVNRYRKELGSGNVTFEQAKNVVQPLADLFSQSPGSRHSPQDLAARTFIIRADYPNPYVAEEILAQVNSADGTITSDPLSTSLQSDYPDLNLSDQEKRNLLRKIGSDNTGCVVEGRAYVVLPRVNQISGSIIHPPTDELIPRYQYHGDGQQVNCSPIEPGTKLTSTILHEVKHLDDLNDPKPLETDLIASNMRVEAKYSGRPPQTLSSRDRGTKRNFVIDFKYEGGKLGFSSLFDEILADQTMAAISVQAGIPYTLSYTTPLELANLQSVLDQSGISQKELRELHQQSSISEFLLKIAGAAQNIDLPSDEDRLDFGFQRLFFRLGGIPNIQTIVWKDFSPHFSRINTIAEAGFDPETLKFPMFHTSPESLRYYDQKFRSSCY